jgi:hypothetical protein
MALSITHSYVSAVPDAGDASLVQPSDWNDVHDISGLAAGIEDFLATPSSANLATAVTDETGSGALVFANTPTLVTPVLGVATGSTLTLTQGTITDPATMISGTVTWNDAADTFTAWKLNVTSTASAAASMLVDLQVAGSGVFAVLKTGSIYLNGAPTSTPLGGVGITGPSGGSIHVGAINGVAYLGRTDIFGADVRVDTDGIKIKSTGRLGWSADTTSFGTLDVALYRDAAATLALRNSTTAQTFRVYNTADGSPGSNYERVEIVNSQFFTDIYTSQAGTGAVRGLGLGVNGGRIWYINTSGHFLSSADNTYDIGASGATRPRTGYFGTSVVIAGNTAITGGTHTIAVPAGAMFAAATSGAASASLDSGSEDVNYQVFDFDASADEYVHFTIPMPNSWNEGTVTFQVLWSSTATDTDGVAWGLQGVAVSDNDAINAAYGTPIVVTDDAQSAAGELYITSVSSAVTIAGTPAAGDMVFFRLFRDVSDANDDMTEDARLLGVRVLYTVNAANDA